MNKTCLELALQGLETAGNPLLALDPQASEQLAAEHGRCIGIQLTDTPITLYCVPDAQGQLQLFSGWEGTPDCVIQGTLLDLIRASESTEANQLLFTGRLRITGDLKLGQRFSRILGNLNLDWEEHLSHWIGDTATYHLGQSVRQAQQRRTEYRSNLQHNLADYLTEEIRLTPHAAEQAAQSQTIGILRDDIERLSQRLTDLEQQNS